MNTRRSFFSEVELQCSICGLFSQKFVVQTDENGNTSQRRKGLQSWADGLKATGYLEVKLYDDTKPMCCRECAEILLGRRTQEPQPEVPF
jgi:hypothetical protein